MRQTISPNQFLGYAAMQTFGDRQLAGGRGVWRYLTCVTCDSADVGIRCPGCRVVFCCLCYGQHDDQDEPGDPELDRRRDT